MNNHSVTESEDDEMLSELNSGTSRPSCSSGSSSSDGNSDSSSADSSDEDGGETDNTQQLQQQQQQQQHFDTLELAQIGGELFRLPRGLCENANIFYEFFSLNTWGMLPLAVQAQLQEYLPRFTHLLTPEQAAAEQTRTIVSLFNSGNNGAAAGLQRFGETPLSQLQNQLEEGNLRPDVLKLRQSISKSQRRERRFQNCERASYLAKELSFSREQLLRNAYKSAPDTLPLRMQRKRRKLEQPFQNDNNLYAVRARKRYCAELQDLVKELNLDFADISADEEDADAPTPQEIAALNAVSAAKSAALDETATATTTTTTTTTQRNATKKSIYDTFFRRQKDRDDEDVIRAEQELRHTRLTDKNYKQYLRDYKRRKLRESHLPEFDTTDIRLRDVCTRAQVAAVFKPGRKPKARFNEPPALVPIQSNSNSDSQAVILTNNVTTKEATSSENERFIDNDDEQQQQQLNENEFVQQQQQQQEQMIAHLPAAMVDLPQQVLRTPERQMPKLEPLSNSPIKQNKLKTPPTAAAAPSATTPTTPAATTHPCAVVASVSPLKTPPMIRISPTILAPVLMQETHACYFSLIRDFFCATPNHRMRYEELKAKLDIWISNPIAALNDWYMQATNWSELLQSAINFLAGSYAVLPSDYVPYIEHKTQLNIYQWIGASRDSDARIVPLYNFWQQRRKELTIVTSPLQNKINTQKILTANAAGGMVIVAPITPTALQELTSADDELSRQAVATTTPEQQQISQQQTPPTPPPRYPTNWTVRPATPTETVEFQRQERLRFEQAHRAFTYRMHGYESVVGPVKGIYSQILSLTKARGHSIMVDDRPNFVTILTLVRDATARLPNGEGTRADISELLKCSQYINPQASENVLQTIISGALDRMHSGHDPCVRYEPKRKIWIYLHRNRTEAEFERLHQHNQTLGKQKPKVNRKPKIATKKDGSIVEPDGSIQILQAVDTTKQYIATPVPALVPASAVVIKKPVAAVQQQQQQPILVQQQQQQQQTLPGKCPPVPPLKYNIPNANQQQQQQQVQQQQKSLLKMPLNVTRTEKVVQAQVISNISNSPRLKTAPGSSSQVKQYTFPVAQAPKTMQLNTATSISGTIRNITTGTASSAAAATTTTPIYVSTPSGLQTVHVANTTATNTLTATVGGKKVSLAKPIVINQITQQQLQQHQQQQQQQQPVIIKQAQPVTKQLGNVIIPMETQQLATGSNQQQQQQQTQQQPKNFIRVMPVNASNAKQPVQIIGQRVLAQTTMRTVQQQQQPQTTQQQQQPKTIGTVTATANKTTIPAGGTVLKMSAQAFAALQQKQAGGVLSGQQVLVKHGIGANQRIVVGSTAISGNKNIVFQPVTAQRITTSTASQTQASGATTVTNITKVITPTGNKIQTLNTTNLTPQQQRVLFQNLKQQQQQQQVKTTVIPTAETSPTPVRRVINLAEAKTQPAGVVSQVTRLVRANNIQTQQQQQQQQTPTTGQIITLDNLLQKQAITSVAAAVNTSNAIRIANSTTAAAAVQTANSKMLSAGNIIQLATNSAAVGGNINTTNKIGATATTATPFQVVTSARNIITLGAANQPRLITTQAGNAASVLTTPVSVTKLATGQRVVTTTNATKLIGKTATTTVVGSNAGATITNLQGKPVMLPTVKNVVRTVTASGQSGGQVHSVIIGGQTVKLQGATTAQRVTTTGQVVPNSQLQTVIMGNQILRLQQLPTAANQTQQQQQQQQQRIAGATGQTIRLQNATATKNIVVASNVATSTAGTVINSKTTGLSNVTGSTGNVLFAAVQGGGQILLSPAFQGSGINLKPMQNMKVVSLPMSKAGGGAATLSNKLVQQATTAVLKMQAAKAINSSNSNNAAAADGSSSCS